MQINNTKLIVEDKIAIASYLPKTKIGEADAEELILALYDIIGEKKYALLMDLREMMFISNAARKHFANQNHQNIVAVGLLVNSQIQKSFVNFYFLFAKPQITTKMFTDYDSAIAWLNNQHQLSSN